MPADRSFARPVPVAWGEEGIAGSNSAITATRRNDGDEGDLRFDASRPESSELLASGGEPHAQGAADVREDGQEPIGHSKEDADLIQDEIRDAEIALGSARMLPIDETKEQAQRYPLQGLKQEPAQSPPEQQPKKRMHLYDIVQMAVEADKRKCTASAAVCPCYLFATPPVRNTLKSIQQNWVYITVNVSLTIFCIVAQDILLAFFPKSVDRIFESVYIVACCVFLLDTVFASTLDRKTIGTFYWFLDVAAALSLLLDVTAIADALISLTGESGEASSSLKIVKTTVRSGTRVGRILRLLRILRLVRIQACIRYFRKLDLAGTC